MKPWILLDSAPIPGGGELHLWQHVRDFVIRVGRDELMSSIVHGSEEALASLACARLGGRPALRVLVGGLGMGFTAAAALRAVGADGRVVVAELIPAVVAWNRGPLAHLAGAPLSDPRLSVAVGDVADLLRTAVGAYDAILLDVDNGPRSMTTGSNNWLYTAAGLAKTRRALRPGGVLAVWSAGGDEAFTTRLKQVGFTVEVVPARSSGSKGSRHVIWIGVNR